MDLLGMSDAYQSQVLNDVRRAEREKCIAILEEEMERGRGLLGLLDLTGKPVFDDKTTMACTEAIQYCITRLRSME